MNRPIVRVLIIAIWLGSFAILTYKLLDPNPIPKGLEPPVDWAYFFAKSFHVGCYFWVTFLGLYLWRSLAWRIGYAAFMVWHGIGTEIGQSYIPTRSGSVKDVAIDYTGITLACLAIWIWERNQSRK